MRKTMNAAALLLVLASGGAGAGAALAANGQAENEPAEMQALMAAKTTALQAGQAAEAKVGGKVSWIEFGMRDGKPSYRVEVVKPDGQAQDVTVDAATGQVTDAVADKPDQGDDEQDEEEGGENG